MSAPRRGRDVTRRGIFLAATAIPLAACEAPYGIDYKMVRDSFAVSLGLEQPPGVTLEQASQVPYSSLGYRVGHAPEQMLVLGSSSGSANLWTSAERRSIVTKTGRITKTAGFPWNLSETYWHSPDALAEGLHVTVQPTLRLLDFKDADKFGVRLQGEFKLAGETEVTILGAKISTLRLLETCHCEDFDWDFQNEFWIDRQTGFAWRSIQYVHPNLEPFMLEIFRPPE